MVQAWNGTDALKRSTAEAFNGSRVVVLSRVVRGGCRFWPRWLDFLTAVGTGYVTVANSAVFFGYVA
jgi:hypothetical protein